MSEEFILEVTNNYSNFEEWLFYYRVGRNLSDEEIKHMRQSFNSQQSKIDEQEKEIDKYKKGHERYEIVRKMNPRMFDDVYKLNISTCKPFDQIIDELKPFFNPNKDKP